MTTPAVVRHLTAIGAAGRRMLARVDGAIRLFASDPRAPGAQGACAVAVRDALDEFAGVVARVIDEIAGVAE